MLYVRDNKLKTESMFVECFDSPVAASSLNFAWKIRIISEQCNNIDDRNCGVGDPNTPDKSDIFYDDEKDVKLH